MLPSLSVPVLCLPSACNCPFRAGVLRIIAPHDAIEAWKIEDEKMEKATHQERERPCGSGSACCLEHKGGCLARCDFWLLAVKEDLEQGRVVRDPDAAAGQRALSIV